MLLGSDYAAPTLRKALQAIERNARTQAQLVDDLLNFARLGAGRLELAREPIDICGTVAALAIESRPETDRLGLTLKPQFRRSPAPSTDPQRVQQIVSNLLANALKFTDAGGHVRLRVEPAATTSTLACPTAASASRRNSCACVRALSARGSVVDAASRRPRPWPRDRKRADGADRAGRSKRAVMARGPARLSSYHSRASPQRASRLSAVNAADIAACGAAGKARRSTRNCDARCSLRGRLMSADRGRWVSGASRRA